MASRRSVYTEDDLKFAFEKELDKNGDGFLSYSELRQILKRGEPTFDEKELRTLWRNVDRDRNDRVEFDEFVDYVYKKPRKPAKEKWKDTFLAYSGLDDAMDQEEFLSLCSGCGLLDDGFSAADAEDVFKKVCKPETKETKEVIGPKGFSKAMARIAKCKGVKKKAIERAVQTGKGPATYVADRKSLLEIK
mmetsp:Transcript_3157/g.5555  ORF Transcript_3157/g.5555 Transcript_3157/m.5555 type:complete len:191 (-) Transcript_3157:35-607(-)